MKYLRKFRLARIHRLRRQLERARRLEFAALTMERESRALALEESRRWMEEARRRMRSELRDGIHPDRWRLLTGYLDSQERIGARRQQAVLELRQSLRRARERLSDAGKERRILDRLSEVWAERLQREERRIEALLMNEIGIREAYLRKREEGEAGN